MKVVVALVAVVVAVVVVAVLVVVVKVVVAVLVVVVNRPKSYDPRKRNVITKFRL